MRPPSPDAGGAGGLRYIAVDGIIGVGKSTLALRLAAHLGAELICERPDENPFLERFYREGAAYALPVQLVFLLQRAGQLQLLAQPGRFAPCVVSDYLFDKDALFARLNLSDEEFRLYALLHARLAPGVPVPQLVIWLRAPMPTLLDRIRRRGIRMEQRIAADYLERLEAAYAAHFAGYRAAPVLAVETEGFHPAASDADFDELLRRMAAAVAGPERIDAAGAPSAAAGSMLD